jgi:hypothetical protein
MRVVARVQRKLDGAETRLVSAPTAGREGFPENNGDFVRRNVVSVVCDQVDPRRFTSFAGPEVFRRVEWHLGSVNGIHGKICVCPGCAYGSSAFGLRFANCGAAAQKRQSVFRCISL